MYQCTLMDEASCVDNSMITMLFVFVKLTVDALARVLHAFKIDFIC